MKPEAQAFYRPDGTKKNVQYLMDSLNREIDRGRERENHAKREEGLKRQNDKKDRSGRVIRPAGAAANEAGDGKGGRSSRGGATGDGKGKKDREHDK